MNQKVLLGLLVVSLGLNTYLLFQVVGSDSSTLGQEAIETQNYSLQTGNKPTDDIDITEHSEPVLEKYIVADVDKEKRQLAEKIAELEQELAEIKSSETISAGFSNDLDSEFAKEAAAMSEDVLSRFESEEEDYTWSNETKVQLDQLFAEKGLLSDLQVKDMQCKETICKVSIAPYDGASQGHLLGAAMKVTQTIVKSDNKALSGMRSIFNINDSSGQVEIFLYNTH
ncbi:MAG: hypothetical protein CMP47_11085 [Rickettsiales bacterium]|nr:hypothetical protein [Rickettsiales bacterium]